MLSKQVEVKEN